MTTELSESINNLHKEIHELRIEQNEFRVSIAKYITSISRDTEWVREKINNINIKFDKCGFCSSTEVPDTFKKSIQEIKDEQNRVKWIAVGAASVLSIAITGILWIVQNKDKLFP